jgi:hypothetical protein
MPLSWAPEVARDLAPFLAASAGAPAAPVGDVASRRAAMEPFFAMIHAMQPVPDDVVAQDYHATAGEGT